MPKNRIFPTSIDRLNLRSRWGQLWQYEFMMILDIVSIINGWGFINQDTGISINFELLCDYWWRVDWSIYWCVMLIGIGERLSSSWLRGEVLLTLIESRLLFIIELLDLSILNIYISGLYRWLISCWGNHCLSIVKAVFDGRIIILYLGMFHSLHFFVLWKSQILSIELLAVLLDW